MNPHHRASSSSFETHKRVDPNVLRFQAENHIKLFCITHSQCLCYVHVLHTTYIKGGQRLLVHPHPYNTTILITECPPPLFYQLPRDNNNVISRPARRAIAYPPVSTLVVVEASSHLVWRERERGREREREREERIGSSFSRRRRRQSPSPSP